MLKSTLLNLLDTLKNPVGSQLKSTELDVPVSFLDVYLKTKNCNVSINGTNIAAK